MVRCCSINIFAIKSVLSAAFYNNWFWFLVSIWSKFSHEVDVPYPEDSIAKFIFYRAKHWTADNGAGLLLYLIVINMLPAAAFSFPYMKENLRLIYIANLDCICCLLYLSLLLTKTADLEWPSVRLSDIFLPRKFFQNIFYLQKNYIICC